MRHILCCSGGKDSVATGLIALEKNEPLDIMVFSEVMYDHSRNISGEDPEHIAFVYDRLKPYFEARGVEFVIVKSERDYLSFFRHIVSGATKFLEHNGMTHGFPLTSHCGIQRDLKVRPIEKYLRSIKEPFVQYIGYAADETKRLRTLQNHPTWESLLLKYDITEKDAYKMCEERGLLSPLYRLSRRGGCWFCPNSKIEENIELRDRWPEIWNELVSLEKERNLAFPVWNLWGDTLQERNEKILRR